MKQIELADRVEMDPKYLCRIENGHSGVSNELLVRIGNELGRSLDYFYMDNPEVRPEYAMHSEIARKLEKCSNQQLLLINNLIDAVIISG